MAELRRHSKRPWPLATVDQGQSRNSRLLFLLPTPSLTCSSPPPSPISALPNPRFLGFRLINPRISPPLLRLRSVSGLIRKDVRSAKFIARKQWVVAGADDMFIRVYNYNTMDKVKVFEAHTDYIRCVAVHPTLPYVLSSSDDMLIKLWDWEKGWICTQIFEGHSHYVMQVTFNPKDTNTFASASLDRTVKIWNLASPDPNFTLDAHSKGVNCVDYFTGGDRPYLITGSDDQTAKVTDGERLPLAVKELGSCDLYPQNLYWADSGDLLVIASDTSFYILKYKRDVVFSYLESGKPVDDQGVEDAFELLHEVNERLEMAEECLSQAVDLSGLLLLYSALGDAEGITKLASLAKEQGKNNVAFLCLFMLGKLEDCLELLVESNRIPEAALMARSYLPSKVSEIVSIWKKDLNKVNPKASESLADPEEYPNLFEDWQVALAVESNLAHDRGKYAPAEEYLSYAEKSEINLVEVFKSMQVDEERLPLENGDSGHEMMEEDVIEEGQDEAVEHDVNDSTDSTVPVCSVAHIRPVNALVTQAIEWNEVSGSCEVRSLHEQLSSLRIPNHYKLWLARDGARCFTSRVTIYGSDGHDGEEKNPKALKLLPFKRWTSEIGPSGLLDSRFHTMGCHK
ncbi:hypothetical protein MUK42_11205 [Musa troglodytarum]|uniref:COPA/B TPR domain-containing protein n=1 Tax=Musa troglodytarum TaxID=320322 RepID=A0A9E7GT40_9LILI|nr:hypothetical protein MUK42_11205 [Musa troglodytarum]